MIPIGSGVRCAARLCASVPLVLLLAGCGTVRVGEPAPPAPPAPLDSARADVDESTNNSQPVLPTEVEPIHGRDEQTGEATYYADLFEGRRTASGVVFRQSEPYAAHRTLPFGTVVRVTNLRNGRSIDLQVVDRGPWGSHANRARTIIDVSRSAAETLGFIHHGRTPVRVEILHRGPEG